MTAYVFPTGFFGLPTGDQLNSLANNGAVTITSGTIDGVAIGSTVPAAGAFTTLTATNAVTFSPASHSVVLSPSGTGVVTIHPNTAGAMDNVVIGATTPLAGKFTAVNATSIGATTPGTAVVTTFTASGVALLSNASVSMTNLPAADPHVVGQLWANSHVVTVSNG